jgi:hypothetical protein
MWQDIYWRERIKYEEIVSQVRNQVGLISKHRRNCGFCVGSRAPLARSAVPISRLKSTVDWFVVREKHFFSWKNKLKSTDYKPDKQSHFHRGTHAGRSAREVAIAGVPLHPVGRPLTASHKWPPTCSCVLLLAARHSWPQGHPEPDVSEGVFVWIDIRRWEMTIHAQCTGGVWFGGWVKHWYSLQRIFLLDVGCSAYKNWRMSLFIFSNLRHQQIN